MSARAIFLALAIPMLIWPKAAEWFVCSCITLALIFGGIVFARALKGTSHG